MNKQENFLIKVSFISILALVFITGGLTFSKGANKIKAMGAASYDRNLLNTAVYLPNLYKDFPPKNIFGAQLEMITQARGLEQMVQAKSVWTRRDFVWRLVEPAEGARNWDAVKYYEDELVTASQNGINTILILLETPEWARIDPACGGKVKPEKLPALASFVHDLVARYSKPPYNLKYIEMWNEPDVDGFLGCWGDVNDTSYYGGREYGEMLKFVYPFAKSANPTIQFIVGGLLLDCDPNLVTTKDCTPAYFLKGILESGAANAFDGVAFHSGDYYLGELGKYHNPNFVSAWNTTGPVTAAKANFLKNLLAQYNITGKYLIDTEAGIKCDHPSCPDPAYGFEETKAYYVVQDGATALAGDYKANIWYSVYGDKHSGLLTRDNQPLPAYNAFQYMSRRLENHTIFQEISAYPGVKGYEFWSPLGVKQWVLWSLDGDPHEITLPALPVRTEKISETGIAVELVPSTTLSIGIAPVFIQY